MQDNGEIRYIWKCVFKSHMFKIHTWIIFKRSYTLSNQGFIRQYGGAVGSVSVSPHHVPCSVPSSGYCLYGFPTHKKHASSWISYTQLPLGVNACVYDVLCRTSILSSLYFHLWDRPHIVFFFFLAFRFPLFNNRDNNIVRSAVVEWNPSFLWHEDTINRLYIDLVTVLSLCAAGL